MDPLIFKSKYNIFINYLIVFIILIDAIYPCQNLMTNHQSSQELSKITEIVFDCIISPSHDSNGVEIVILFNVPSNSSILIRPSNLMLAVRKNDIGIPAMRHVSNLDRLIVVIFYPNKYFFYNSLYMGSQMKDDDTREYLNYRIHLHVWPEIIIVEDEAIFALNKLFYFKNLTSQIELDNDDYIVFVYSKDSKINIQIWEIYYIKTIRIVQKINFISNEMGKLNWNDLIRKIPRRANFQGDEITAIAGDTHDYDFESKFVDNKNLSVLESGSAVQMYWVLRDALNFSVRAVRGSWNEELENGTLSGMAIALINGEVDLCISLQPLTIQIAKQLTFLHPTEVDIIRAFFVQPSNSAVRDIYLTVHSPIMWSLGAVVFLGLAIIFRTLIWFHIKRPRWFKYEEEMSLAGESFLWSAAIICQQGWYNIPYFVSTKVVFICGYFTGLICYVAFSATIVSKLSVEIKPISNLDDLINFNYILYTDKDTAQYQFTLPDVPNGQMKSMEVEGMDLSDAFTRIVKSKSALLSYDDVLLVSSRDIKSEDLLCDIVSSIPALKKNIPFSMSIKKNSPFREFFNQKIIFMKERGLNQRFDMLYNDGVKLDCMEKRHLKKQLGLEDLFTTIIVIFLGFTCSFIILLVERYHKIVLCRRWSISL